MNGEFIAWVENLQRGHDTCYSLALRVAKGCLSGRWCGLGTSQSTRQYIPSPNPVHIVLVLPDCKF